MKVLHLIAGGDAGGAKTHVLNLLGQLQKSEETALLCLGDGVLAREAAAAGLDVTVVPRHFSRGLEVVKERSKTADILHCHGSRANLTGALAKASLDCPVISTIHSDHRLDYLRRPLAHMSYGTLNAWALRRMDALVCVSEAMADEYTRRGFAPVYPIYNGLDFASLPPDAAQPLPEEWGIARNPGDILVVTAARFNPVKDLPTLIRGFALAAERHPELKLVIAGDGAEAPVLRQLVEQTGLAGRIFLPGWLEDTDRLYAAGDIVALTSLSETFPYALTQGARLGKAAVATAVGGVPALIRHGETGLLIPPKDPQALAEALCRLASDAPLRRELGENLRRHGRENFSLEAMGARQREIYSAVRASV